MRGREIIVGVANVIAAGTLALAVTLMLFGCGNVCLRTGAEGAIAGGVTAGAGAAILSGGNALRDGLIGGGVGAFTGFGYEYLMCEMD